MTYKIFICHSYAHRQIYSDLVGKLNDAARFKWRNRSVQYDMRFGTDDAEVDNDELRAEIAARIADCDAFLVLTKPVASRRRWLQWEITYARQLGIPVIGVARRLKDRVSVYVRDRADDIVDTWRTDHIVNAITLHAEAYRAKQAQSIILPPPPALPTEQPDGDADIQPTPVPPDESNLEAEAGEPPRPPTPRDVLLAGSFGKIVPRDILPAMTAARAPKWWWPFRGRAN